MSDKKVRVGFVGVGGMGQCAHLRNYDTVDDCEVVAIAELREKTAERVAERFSIPNVYSDAAEMLEKEELDCIVSSQPFNRHAILLPELLKANKPVFIEKPLSSTIESAKVVLESLATSETFVMVGYHKRSDPATMYAKELFDQFCASGELGAFKYARLEMPVGDWVANGFLEMINEGDAAPSLECEPKPTDMDDATYQKYQDFVNYYIHQVNLMRHFIGDYSVKYADPSGVLFVGESEAGVPCTIEMNAFTTTIDWQEHVFLAFEKGWIKVDLPAPLANNRPGKVTVMRDPGDGATPTITQPQLPWVHAMRQQAMNFLAAVKGERAPMCDAPTALKDLEVAREYIRLLTGK